MFFSLDILLRMFTMVDFFFGEPFTMVVVCTTFDGTFASLKSILITVLSRFRFEKHNLNRAST
jgi:hypothetical protein